MEEGKIGLCVDEDMVHNNNNDDDTDETDDSSSYKSAPSHPLSPETQESSTLGNNSFFRCAYG